MVIQIIAHQKVLVTMAVQTATATVDPQMDAVEIKEYKLYHGV